MENRSNAEWLEALTAAGPGQAAALADLYFEPRMPATPLGSLIS